MPAFPPSEIKRSTSLHQSHTQPHSEKARKYSLRSSNKQQGRVVTIVTLYSVYNITEKPVAQVKPKVVKQFPTHQAEMSSTEWCETTVSTPSLQFSSSPVNKIRKAESMKVRALLSQSTPAVAQENTMAERSRTSSVPFKPSPLLLSSSSPPAKPAANKRFNLEKDQFKFNSLPRGFKLQQSKAFIEGMGTQIMYASASHISAKSLLLERASKLLKETQCVELKEKLEQVSL